MLLIIRDLFIYIIRAKSRPSVCLHSIWCHAHNSPAAGRFEASLVSNEALIIEKNNAIVCVAR